MYLLLCYNNSRWVMHMENKYHDFHIPLEEREKDLFSKIAQVDRESLQLYKILFEKRKDKVVEEDILSRLTKLNHLFEEIKDGYYYLYALEVQNKKYANLRAMGKAILTIITTAFAFEANPILGIASFVALSKLAGDEYVKELEYFDEVLNQYNCADQMTTIQNTLGNCTFYAEKPKEYRKKED